MVSYDSNFFDYNEIAFPSARAIVPMIRDMLPPIANVVDFGCARGLWLSVWRHDADAAVLGVDGAYVDTSKLMIPRDDFHAADLSAPIDLARHFDLVQSLEVAEHLPRASSGAFVESLTRHGAFVLFSAAPPGQGGENHVNERPYAFWRDLFARHDFALFDCVRPRVAANPDVLPWYRYNLFLYARTGRISDLPDTVTAAQVPPGARIPDVSPTLYQVRKQIVRLLPDRVENYLARRISRAHARPA